MVVDRKQVQDLENQIVRVGVSVVVGKVKEGMRKKAYQFVRQTRRQTGKPPTVDTVLQFVDASPEYLRLCERIGYSREDMVTMCREVGAVDGGVTMTGKEKTKRTRKGLGLFTPMEWHQPAYQRLASLLVTRLGIGMLVVIVGLVAASAFDQDAWVARLGILFGVVVGALVGGVGVVLVMNRMEGDSKKTYEKAMAERKAAEKDHK